MDLHCPPRRPRRLRRRSMLFQLRRIVPFHRPLDRSRRPLPPPSRHGSLARRRLPLPPILPQGPPPRRRHNNKDPMPFRPPPARCRRLPVLRPRRLRPSSCPVRRTSLEGWRRDRARRRRMGGKCHRMRERRRRRRRRPADHPTLIPLGEKICIEGSEDNLRRRWLIRPIRDLQPPPPRVSLHPQHSQFRNPHTQTRRTLQTGPNSKRASPLSTFRTHTSRRNSDNLQPNATRSSSMSGAWRASWPRRRIRGKWRG